MSRYRSLEHQRQAYELKAIELRRHFDTVAQRLLATAVLLWVTSEVLLALGLVTP